VVLVLSDLFTIGWCDGAAAGAAGAAVLRVEKIM